MYLLDTNILSELARRQPNQGVIDWMADKTTATISAVTLEEILYGLTWRPIPRITEWFDHFFEEHCEILPTTEAVATVSGQLRGRLQAQGKPRTQADMLIAATARVHGLTLVTGNLRDFEGCGLPILNPFT